ncbi:beta-ketoacyl synthase N-terminal-like domain-containing protein [Streptomyces hygroscopicus]|uniref:3-oxoacyl-[acyl-carrier-protein] synthase 2 n=1 Tax=Streptomyces hygroscopicus TaxID=1912 RepID=A0ABQ3U2F2_STRHY|nr:beta-ketoacyl synthase N-terminal-like domain-containing protein [Streptomyces hygroscopicus]MBW8086523.1 beta-ketoacyl synthase [Streptomyces hygroscopicus subsp. hygroscopicus]GHJ29767.1 3-oxoacyl-[acyl-carrier-protein] synthase 2 [Streptomyces hygroscopicus]
MSTRGSAVAVTGLGVCGPGGVGVAALWEALSTGRAHRPPITAFDATGATLGASGEVPGPTGGDGTWRALDLAETAVSEALDGLDGAVRERVALVLGTTDPGAVPPRPGYCAGELAPACAERTGLGGEALTIANASASGAAAIAVARDLVAAGEAATAVAGGADAVTDMAFLGLNSLRTLGPEGCRPFSTRRRGIGLSEGAAVLRLEPLGGTGPGTAGRPLAVLAGCGMTNATGHLAAPGADGIELAVRLALADAGLAPEDIDFVNTHGPGTRRGDTAEIEALRAVFGPRLSSVPVNSVKGVLWHLQGGAGAVEALTCVLSLTHRAVTPTWGAEPVDPVCDGLDLVLEDAPRPMPDLRTALSVSCGLGGMNTALVLRRA